MANRRMFSKTITSSSRFLMMPQSSQNLYFHFGMNADDDGFCEHFMIMRMVEAKPDDLKVLHGKGFVQVFDDKVLVITDWKENNYLRPDRYQPSKYLEIYKKEIEEISRQSNTTTFGIPSGDQMDTQDRIGKDRIGKVREQEEETPTQFAHKFFSGDKDLVLSIMNKLRDEGVPKEIIIKELVKFKEYWTEPNKSGTKQRWELERTFDTWLRLKRWYRNVDSTKQQIRRSGTSTTV